MAITMSFWGTKFLFKTYKRKLFNKFSQKHIARIAARTKIPWTTRIWVFCTKARMGNAKILEIVKKKCRKYALKFWFFWQFQYARRFYLFIKIWLFKIRGISRKNRRNNTTRLHCSSQNAVNRKFKSTEMHDEKKEFS